MAIKHEDVKASGDKGYAAEWNKDHAIEDNTIQTVHIADSQVTTAKINIDANLPFNSKKITGLATPTADYDGATKKYVDDNIVTDLNKCVLKLQYATGIPRLAWEGIPWDVEIRDENNMHSNTTNPTRINIKKAGYYLILVNLYWQTQSNAKKDLRIYKNGNTELCSVTDLSGLTELTTQTIAFIDKLNVNDYIEIQAQHNYGTDIDVAASSTCAVSWIL